VGGFKLTDLSEAPAPDSPPTTGYFFAVRLPDGRVGHAGVSAEGYLLEPDDSLWRARVLAWLNDMEPSSRFGLIADGLVHSGLIVLGRTDSPPERGPFPRPLTDVEKAAARKVLELNDTGEVDILREQLEAAVATHCDGHDPSIGIEVDHDKAKPISNRAYLNASAVWERGSIMVWIDDGWLTYLEIDWYGETPHGFPPVSNIRPEPHG
jgi:hypothetical protein